MISSSNNKDGSVMVFSKDNSFRDIVVDYFTIRFKNELIANKRIVSSIKSLDNLENHIKKFTPVLFIVNMLDESGNQIVTGNEIEYLYKLTKEFCGIESNFIAVNKNEDLSSSKMWRTPYNGLEVLTYFKNCDDFSRFHMNKILNYTNIN